ncbi:glycerophosphodiester phosphodiesterase [Leifsonia sp. AG29]|uniref:glycerophosphodiester phosphodiesterase n=1 Tax=Leifsonia sp. AG29 TaxID=2598860 RepID=UPI00131ED101|nr:glycerophosphodiester phosphodiesterase [Leifsonia sp. AG29]
MTFLSGPKPRIIAHRGLALEAPENTLLAFLKALSAGATHLETDVHASADGVAVISHDPDLSRTAGREVRVGQLTMTELRRVQLGQGQGFASLAEALEAFPEARFNVDVKGDDAVEPTVRAIREARAPDRVLITSFSSARRRRVVQALPGVATSPGVSEFTTALAGAKLGLGAVTRRSLAGFTAVQAPRRRGPVSIVTRRTVRRFQEAGVEVHVWTINDPAEMTQLLDLGVDGIVTDRCDVLHALLAERRA